MRDFKTICVLIFVLLSSFSSFSQNYDKITDTNKLWKDADIYWILFGGQPDYIYYKFSGDTTINMINYKILWSTEDTANSPWLISSFIREDSTGKVFSTRYIDSVHVEGLLYDFGMNVGDSALITMSYSCDSLWVKAIQVDSVFIYNKYCKRIFTNQYDGYLGSNIYWIEGIGSIQGIKNPTNCVTGGMPYLICYMENDTLKFENPEFENCIVPTIINDTKIHDELLIYPNPANKEINVEFAKDIEHIKLEIFNSIGQVVYSININNRHKKIDVSSFTSGIYLIKLSNNKFSHLKKIFIK